MFKTVLIWNCRINTDTLYIHRLLLAHSKKKRGCWTAQQFSCSSLDYRISPRVNRNNHGNYCSDPLATKCLFVWSTGYSKGCLKTNCLPELHFRERGNEFYKPAAAFLAHGNSFITEVLSHFFFQQSLLSKQKKTILRQCRELVR